MNDEWFDELPKLVKRVNDAPTGGGIDTDANNPWLALFEQHPEGGGPYGGRDNALTVLVGFFRAKGFPHDAALGFAVDWNNRHCSPPLDEAAVRSKVSKAWIVWGAGTLPDNTPDGPKPIEILRWPDMQRKVVELGQLDWLVPNMLLAGGLTFMSAPAGGGKSWVAADLVRCCTTGDYWLGSVPVRQCKVLYIDEEMGCAGMFHRLDALNANPTNLFYTDQQGVRLDNATHMTQLLDTIKANNIQLVIIDTFVRVHGMDENDNSKMSALYASFKQIKQLGCAVLCLHHNRKTGTDSAVAHEQMRGAGDIAAQADTVFSISKKDGLYTLKTTKNRHGPETDYVLLNWTIDTDADGTRLNPTADGAVDIDLPTRILLACPASPPTTVTDGLPTGNDVFARTGGNRREVLRLLAEMATAGTLATVQGPRRALHYYKPLELNNV